MTIEYMLCPNKSLPHYIALGISTDAIVPRIYFVFVAIFLLRMLITLVQMAVTAPPA